MTYSITFAAEGRADLTRAERREEIADRDARHLAVRAKRPRNRRPQPSQRVPYRGGRIRIRARMLPLHTRKGTVKYRWQAYVATLKGEQIGIVASGSWWRGNSERWWYTPAGRGPIHIGGRGRAEFERVARRKAARA